MFWKFLPLMLENSSVQYFNQLGFILLIYSRNLMLPIILEYFIYKIYYSKELVRITWNTPYNWETSPIYEDVWMPLSYPESLLP